MEVMNSTEFEQKDVLVGGSGKTGKFTVTDDPHLMSMLSTSLYANPLRTMIQEIMFNAWDAHRMGKCQDKPIDVYLNETTGLIVRDYGPGINPAEIDTIYCSYGNSTKRQDDTQTGGFGLGSKSPYAYNDSFMVTNHHGGKKSMYIMRRVHDENDGGPGYDLVVENVPTEETGLMVTVPFKSNYDRQKAYKYMKEILFLSGIKVNIHYEGSDEEDELVEAESLAPGEFINADEEPCGLYAVYGGVKYEIPTRDEYFENYEFLKKLSHQLGALYIGFKPNSLTPLPNREGLNMRERSIESITEILETIQEHFYSHLIPATKATMMETLQAAKTTSLQPQFIAYKWQRVGDALSMSEMVPPACPIHDLLENRRPEAFSPSMWMSITKLCLKNSRFVAELISFEKFWSLKGLLWAKEFPEYRHWRYNIIDASKKPETINMEDRRDWAKWIIGVQKKIEAITDGDNKPRVKGDSHKLNWMILTNQRRAGKFDHLSGRKKDIVNALARTKKLKIPEKFYDDQLWFQKDGNPFNHTMKHGAVIIAKTAQALNDTSFRFQSLMVPSNPDTYGYSSMHWSQWVHNSNIQPIAGFIVHKKKGHYDAVKEMLEMEGYQVIEADEPEVKVRVVKQADGEEVEVEEKPKGFPVVDVRRSRWSTDEYVQKPSTYLYCTVSKLEGYDRPYSESFVSQVMKYAPKMVMVHNKVQAAKLSKNGCLSFEERVEQIVEDLLADKERIRIMRLHQFMHKNSSLPKELLDNSEVQKIFGVPYLRTAQKEKFNRDREFLNVFIRNRRHHRYYDTDSLGITPKLKDMVTRAFEVADEDDSVVLARKIAKVSNCFDENVLQSMVHQMKPGERKMFAQKIIRFLRTV
ncbi:RIIA lysis inhibitor [Dinoroseobacter phage DS-1410Ws-06]|uniref:RIIA-like protein n=1 Tax=Dinoroseobacter phage DS-1410Ws-06 TaxID=1815983 RepID=A0A191VYA6_9CAUD|nr:RIIA lysis inhibitor [Dinoroseobacter phage DS-1410Ws-06]ANJ20693.1 rIIA-like protein [Dinoroseobacter phage DS-1410Ws-06]